MPVRGDGWTAFKEAARDRPVLLPGVRAVEAALTLLQKSLGHDLGAVLLFGSFARASTRYDDIDLLIITRRSPGSPHEVTRRLAEQVFGSLFLTHGQLFSFLVYSRDRFRQLKDYLPLLITVGKEGILLYGEDPFDETTGKSVSQDRPAPSGHG